MQSLKSISSLALFAISATSILLSNQEIQAASFVSGNIAVSRVGDGTTLVNSAGPISILEYNSAGALQQTVNISTNATNGLQISGSATSEGALSLNNGQLTIAGYIPPFTGTGSLSSRSDTAAPRGFVSVDITTGTASAPVAIGAYSANNIRGAVSSATGTYFAGGSTGTVYNSNSTNTTIQGSNTNTRVVNIQNGNLYYSTGSVTQGIYGYTGLPTAATAPSAIITGVTGQGTNAYDFAFSLGGNVAYVADATIGIQKFTLSGSTWSLAYNITTATTGLTGLAVDFSTPNPTIYAVNPTTLYSYIDTGAGAATSIATAGTNYAFRGLEVIPEPSTYAAFAVGALVLLGSRRVSRKVA